MGIPVVVYDPAAMKEAQRELGSRVAYASSATDCAAQSDVLVVAVAWDEFTQLRAGDLRRSGRKPTVIDCWRVLDHKEFESAANMIVLGVGPASGRANFDGTE
jgi:UDP-glucose 6-dehydrogenase